MKIYKYNVIYLDLIYMAQKETDITQQLDAIAEQIKLKGFMFKNESDDEDDSDTEDDSDNEDEKEEVNDGSKEENLNDDLKNMNCCFILYLGSMSSNKGLDNVSANCLYNQIKKQNNILVKNGKKMDLVYILFIGPNADKKNNSEIIQKILELTNNTCFITIDNINSSFPVIDSTKEVEQLFLLKDTFFNKTKIARFTDLVNTNNFSAQKNIETDTEFKFLNKEKEIIFLKPTIPVVQSEFFTLLSKIIEYYIGIDNLSKVIIINGFWFETNSALQDVNESYFITNMETSFISNILLGWISYFIPFISEMKQRYDDKFILINQYFHQIPKFSCLDVIPHILS